MRISLALALFLLTLVTACSQSNSLPPTEPEPTGTILRGRYVQEFEREEFVDCNSPIHTFWIKNPEAAREEITKKAIKPGTLMLAKVNVSAEGKYGHLSAYRHEVVIQSLSADSSSDACATDSFLPPTEG